MSTPIIDGLKWRYATKRFDAAKKVSDADLQTLQQAVNLTATSYGLQTFRVALISDPNVKEQLQVASYNQPQLTESSHVFVFANMLDVSDEYVDGFIRLLAETRGIPVDAVQGYADYIKGSLKGKEPAFIQDWTRRQAYIALGTLLATAGELKIDTCPMEGFDAEQVNNILGLPEQGLNACVIATVGYRSEEDKTQHAAKVRLPLEELFL
ncbi:NAD(P)H-dependent oxidoreductase [Neolewinella persica]|uniref:NAD(P)H-dependent oxidoreductase n=1 Tax=Neolewinella persica TaxID=70998 RepID=UPI00037F8175|nr:NAD(P)H-dependent oxidoreductase [Neolewinella persica]